MSFFRRIKSTIVRLCYDLHHVYAWSRFLSAV
jgi:hypothetical protein